MQKVANMFCVLGLSLMNDFVLVLFCVGSFASGFVFGLLKDYALVHLLQFLS